MLMVNDLVGPARSGGRRFRTNMQSADAEGEVLVGHLGKPSRAHHAREGFLIGVHADGFGEIAVGIGVPRNHLAQVRHDAEGVKVVEGANDLPATGEFEHEKASARLEDAVHFRERPILVRHIAHAERNRHHVEGVVGEGKRFGVGLHDGRRQARFSQALGADGEHFMVDVARRHVPRARALGELQGEVPRAARDVEHLHARLHRGAAHADELPPTVKAPAEHVVHDVVFGGDAVEHLADLIGLLVFFDELVAEVNLVGGVFLLGLFRNLFVGHLHWLSGVRTGVTGFGLERRVGGVVRVARSALFLQSPEVLLPKPVVFRREAAQVIPAVETAVVTVGKNELQGVESHRFNSFDADVGLADLQHGLVGGMSLDIGRRGMDTKKFSAQYDRRFAWIGQLHPGPVLGDRYGFGNQHAFTPLKKQKPDTALGAGTASSNQNSRRIEMVPTTGIEPVTRPSEGRMISISPRGGSCDYSLSQRRFYVDVNYSSNVDRINFYRPHHIAWRPQPRKQLI